MSTYGFEISSPCDLDRRAGAARAQRQREQERGQELARHGAADDDRAVERERRRRGADRERREPPLAELVDRAADRAQRVDEVADRTLVHPRRAAQLEARVAARGEREGGDERPHRGSCVAEPERRLLHERPAAETVDDDRAGVAFEAAAELLQRLEHHLRVVGMQQAGDRRRPRREPGEQQGPVRDALRAGNAHRAADA
jgi:hypothetical protein